MINEALLRPRNLAIVIAIVLIWRVAMKKVFAWLDSSNSSQQASQ